MEFSTSCNLHCLNCLCLKILCHHIFSFLFEFRLPRFRQHFSVIIPKPGDLYAALDACKAANCVVFLMSPPSDTSSLAGPKSSDNDGYLGIDQPGEELLAAVMAQGLPTPLFVLNDIENVPLKRRGDYKKALNKHLERIIPIEKLHVIEKENDTLRLLHQIGSQKQRPVYQRDMRSNLLAEETKFVQNDADPTVGCLIVDGFIRYQPLNVNGLVHIPGWGDFQLEKIEVQRNPGGKSIYFMYIHTWSVLIINYPMLFSRILFAGGSGSLVTRNSEN